MQGIASHAGRRPKAPVHKIWGGRRSGRAGEPAVSAVAVFDRPSYSLRALAATAARVFARRRLPESAARTLAERAPPAWVFVHQRLNPQSSTGIRAAGRDRAKGKNG